MAQQLRLSLRRPPSYERAAFVVGRSNALAHGAVCAWPNWHGQAMALFGPEGVGKTHLANIWMEASGAEALPTDGSRLGGAGPVLLEDLDRGFDEEFLFHRINMAAQSGSGLLLTGRTPPSSWPAALPDLRSRLNALSAAEMAPPDDDVLEAVLRAFFGRCNIAPPDEVLSYLLLRIERSVPAAWDIVRRLDAVSGEANRPVSRVLARQVLENDTENLDLFE